MPNTHIHGLHHDSGQANLVDVRFNYGFFGEISIDTPVVDAEIELLKHGVGVKGGVLEFRLENIGSGTGIVNIFVQGTHDRARMKNWFDIAAIQLTETIPAVGMFQDITGKQGMFNPLNYKSLPFGQGTDGLFMPNSRLLIDVPNTSFASTAKLRVYGTTRG